MFIQSVPALMPATRYSAPSASSRSGSVSPGRNAADCPGSHTIRSFVRPLCSRMKPMDQNIRPSQGGSFCTLGCTSRILRVKYANAPIIKLSHLTSSIHINNLPNWYCKERSIGFIHRKSLNARSIHIHCFDPSVAPIRPHSMISTCCPTGKNIRASTCHHFSSRCR